MKLHLHLAPTKINSKWIKDLHVRAKIVKLLEKNQAKASQHWIWNDFLDMTPKEEQQQKIKDKLNSMKILKFCAWKDKINIQNV